MKKWMVILAFIGCNSSPIEQYKKEEIFSDLAEKCIDKAYYYANLAYTTKNTIYDDSCTIYSDSAAYYLHILNNFKNKKWDLNYLVLIGSHQQKEKNSIY